MNEKSWMISCLILAAMLMTAITRIPVSCTNGTPLIEIKPDVEELGPGNLIGQIFTVNVTLYNITDFYGVDLQMKWTTEYIGCVNHTKKIPVETYPDGVLHSPTVPVINTVDETASMSGSAPGTTYWLAEAAMLPAAPFEGNGTVVTFAFNITQQPPDFMDTYVFFNFTDVTLSDTGGSPITHERKDAYILLHGSAQPAGPTLKVVPETHGYKGNVPHLFETNISIFNLDPYWDLGGFDIQVSYDPSFMQAVNLTIDPDGWYENFWQYLFIAKNQTDNTTGRVWVVVAGIPNENGTHTAPYGDATLFTITFNVTLPGSSPLEIITEPPRYLAAYPHPERPEPPFNNSLSSVPIPFDTTNGFANIVEVIEHSISGYTIKIESNSSVSSIYFKPRVPMLLFNVTGVDGFTGYCNITIPKDFMWSTIENGWHVLLDVQIATPTITEDADNTYIYLTYQHSTRNIAIITTSVVPEFGLTTITIFMLSVITLALAMKKRTTKNK
jgi:hypothetical protein